MKHYSLLATITFLYLLFFFIPLHINAQSFNVSSSKDTVLLGNSFRIDINIDNLDGELDLPDLNELGDIMGPSTQFSTSIINGVSSSQKIYTYTIKPLEQGTLVIPEILLTTTDSIYKSDIIDITVLENPEGIIQDDVSEPSIFGRSLRQPRIPKETKEESETKTLKHKLKKI